MAANLEPWKAGFCSCLSYPGTCCKTCCCGPCMYGWNAEKLDGRSCYLHCLILYCCGPFICCCHKGRRQLLREKYHLQEEPCSDLLVGVPCCMGCVICQEANEMELRGPPPQSSMPNA